MVADREQRDLQIGLERLLVRAEYMRRGGRRKIAAAGEAVEAQLPRCGRGEAQAVAKLARRSRRDLHSSARAGAAARPCCSTEERCLRLRVALHLVEIFRAGARSRLGRQREGGRDAGSLRQGPLLARRREADKAIAAERRRARELEMLEDDRLERCRFAGKQNFEQCFFYGSDVPEQPGAAAPMEPAAEKSRRAPPTW